VRSPGGSKGSRIRRLPLTSRCSNILSYRLYLTHLVLLRQPYICRCHLHYRSLTLRCLPHPAPHPDSNRLSYGSRLYFCYPVYRILENRIAFLSHNPTASYRLHWSLAEGSLFLPMTFLVGCFFRSFLS